MNELSYDNLTNPNNSGNLNGPNNSGNNIGTTNIAGNNICTTNIAGNNNNNTGDIDFSDNDKALLDDRTEIHLQSPNSTDCVLPNTDYVLPNTDDKITTAGNINHATIILKFARMMGRGVLSKDELQLLLNKLQSSQSTGLFRRQHTQHIHFIHDIELVEREIPYIISITATDDYTTGCFGKSTEKITVSLFQKYTHSDGSVELFPVSSIF